MPNRFIALVLAAGESRRMGEPKQLLPWGDHTIIEQIVGTLAQSPVDEIVVVLGHRAEAVREKLPTPNSQLPNQPTNYPTIQLIYNPHYHEGMLSSIKCGIVALASDVRAAFIVLCDQPQLKAETIARLRAAFEQSNKGLVVPSYLMRRGHPLLIDMRKYRAKIMAIEGAPGLQKILRDHPNDLLHVEFDDPSVVMDVDTREEYERAKLNLKSEME